MPDLLVPLYKLLAPSGPPEGVEIRPARAYEGQILKAFVETHFYPHWVSEVSVALAATPAKVLIAVEDGHCIGFACFDVTARGFFGPTGVAPSASGRGVGRALLLSALEALKQGGFAYGIIGAAGPVEFYQKTCGAIEIPESDPGFYHNSIA